MGLQNFRARIKRDESTEDRKELWTMIEQAAASRPVSDREDDQDLGLRARANPVKEEGTTSFP